jgi:4-carboxymuconolactone decarboxylase
LPLPALEQMDPAMRAAFVAGAEQLHSPVGPRTAILLTPKVGAALNGVSAALSANSALPQDLYELTIIMVAREWDSQFEWWVHGPQAELAGVPAEVVEAIGVDRTPRFEKPAQEAVYLYLKDLLGPAHAVSDANYQRLLGIIGAKQLVELNVLAGYYTAFAMNLVSHNVPLRAGVAPPLPPRRK